MSAKFRAKKTWEVWSGGMDSKVYEWDFSRGLPTNIYDMSKFCIHLHYIDLFNNDKLSSQGTISSSNV